jgi:hypothetical protein
MNNKSEITNNKINPRCPHCGGQFSAEARFYKQLPVGMGFVTSRFQIDCIQIRGYKGFCMKCGKNGEVIYSTKHITKYPKLGDAK